MKQEGPLLETLTHRLAECPMEFLSEPVIGGKGGVHVDAVVSDLLMDLGGDPLSRRGAEPFTSAVKTVRNRLRLTLVAAWIFHDDFFVSAGSYSRSVFDFLKKGLNELSEIVAADMFVTDPDRREELVRLCLEAVNLRPAGETKAQSADRLKTLGSVERSRVIRKTREAQEKARKLREAMKRKLAREAAAKVNHE